MHLTSSPARTSPLYGHLMSIWPTGFFCSVVAASLAQPEPSTKNHLRECVASLGSWQKIDIVTTQADPVDPPPAIARGNRATFVEMAALRLPACASARIDNRDDCCYSSRISEFDYYTSNRTRHDSPHPPKS
ncbi:hypothetical protein K474DRAFT_1370409 [Panus rudis PR-1116 ss-1]|nr:hypothetical protein K474DRAFT_1370409 [Panus rudis PR-1116 ss-1]